MIIIMHKGTDNDGLLKRGDLKNNFERFRRDEDLYINQSQCLFPPTRGAVIGIVRYNQMRPSRGGENPRKNHLRPTEAYRRQICDV